MEKLSPIAEVVSTAAAAGSIVMAQTGIEPWIPLLVTIINGLFLLLQGRKATRQSRRSTDTTQPLPPAIDASGQRQDADVEPADLSQN